MCLQCGECNEFETPHEQSECCGKHSDSPRSYGKSTSEVITPACRVHKSWATTPAYTAQSMDPGYPHAYGAGPTAELAVTSLKIRLNQLKLKPKKNQEIIDDARN